MDTEAALVSRSRNGEHEAFARLIEMHQTVALRVAYTIAGPDAEDATQDAFVKAFTRLAQFRDGASFRAWLLAIVANEARNRRRSSGRRAAMALRVAGRREATPSDPLDAVAAADSRDRLVRAVSELPVRDREIVALRYFADLSEGETAAALGCPLGTVKSRHSRALDRLRAELGDEVVR